jgi:hypothetical protein
VARSCKRKREASGAMKVCKNLLSTQGSTGFSARPLLSEGFVILVQSLTPVTDIYYFLCRPQAIGGHWNQEAGGRQKIKR